MTWGAKKSRFSGRSICVICAKRFVHDGRKHPKTCSPRCAEKESFNTNGYYSRRKHRSELEKLWARGRAEALRQGR